MPNTNGSKSPQPNQKPNTTRAIGIYTAKITQTSTNAPTAQILHNTTGLTITWARVETGVYKGTLSQEIGETSGYVIMTAQYPGASDLITQAYFSGPDQIRINTKVNAAGTWTLTDGILNGADIEFRIYAQNLPGATTPEPTPINPKTYTALISQSGTAAPTATILANTLGEITFSRDAAGSYILNSDNLFTNNKTTVIMQNNVGSAYRVIGYQSDADEIDIETTDDDGVFADDILANCTLIISVYN